MNIEYPCFKISKQQLWTYVVIQKHDTLYNSSQLLPYSAVFQDKIRSQFLTEIQLTYASALQSAEPPVKNQLARYTATVYIRQVGTAEDMIQNIYDNILHVVPVNMPESQFYWTRNLSVLKM